MRPTSPRFPATEPSPQPLSAVRQGGGARTARATRSIADLRAALATDPELGPRFVHWRSLPARAARSGPFPARLAPALVEAERERGVTELYTHQVRAIEAALDGRDVLVATPTASGKTICTVLPVLQSLIDSGGASRALYLYPTKALAQDQCANLTALMADVQQRLGGADRHAWHACTYDGDTPPAVRRTLRDRGHVVLTNPHMLHAGILPNHPKWAELFRGLAYVVVDEVHTLSGVLGSSVANVLRRLVRIARHYGANPAFLGLSATLPDAAAHARRLFGGGRDLVLVEEDGSPAGERTFGFYNPPLLDPLAGLRANALEEARRLARHVCSSAHQTIFFAQRRTSVEVLTRYLKECAADLGLDPDEIWGYRGGYLPNLRREVEAGLRTGRIKVVVATNALELGIDIGQLDVCVLVGYPGSQASFWQRAGRVGRRGKPSLCLQIARSDPLDQFLARHPERLLEAPAEGLALDPDNLVILSQQLECAAFELPFRRSADGDGVDDPAFGASPSVPAILDYLATDAAVLLAKDGRWHWTADAYPAQNVALDGADPDNVLVVDSSTEKAIGEIDREASLTTVHEGAIYQVQGETWVIERFDHANRRAYARAVEIDHFTEAQTDTELRVLRLEARRQGAAASLWRGEVHVTTVATQFKKIRFYTRENVGCGEIHLPAEELDTETFALVLAEDTVAALESDGLGSAWRGVGTLLRRTAPLFVRCASSDLGLSTQVRSPHFLAPAIFLWDRVQGGVGLAQAIFECFEELCRAAGDVLAHCPCERGCPACVGPVEEVGSLGKQAAAAIFARLASPYRDVASTGSGHEDE